MKNERSTISVRAALGIAGVTLLAGVTALTACTSSPIEDAAEACDLQFTSVRDGKVTVSLGRQDPTGALRAEFDCMADQLNMPTDARDAIDATKPGDQQQAAEWDGLRATWRNIDGETVGTAITFRSA